MQASKAHGGGPFEASASDKQAGGYDSFAATCKRHQPYLALTPRHAMSPVQLAPRGQGTHLWSFLCVLESLRYWASLQSTSVVKGDASHDDFSSFGDLPISQGSHFDDPESFATVFSWHDH